jgi:hypothetical protein
MKATGPKERKKIERKKGEIEKRKGTWRDSR